MALPAGPAFCLDPADYIIAEPGSLPIIISAPHGGEADLPGIGERDSHCGSSSRDRETAEIVDSLRGQLSDLLGGTPYVVISGFHRKYVDLNRSETDPCTEHTETGLEAYADPDAEPFYDYYHEKLRTFVDTVRSRWPEGALLIDIHGQGQPYISRGTQNGDTVSALITRHGYAALTGSDSIFGRLGRYGYPVYPPNTDPPDPPESPNGGFIVGEYGSDNPDGVDAIQIEIACNLRGTEAQATFVVALANAIAAFYVQYLGEGPKIGLLDPVTDFPLFTSCDEDSTLGKAVATGDFNGDGLQDLAVGAPDADVDGAVDAGSVTVYFGTDYGLLPYQAETLDQEAAGATSETSDRFGESLVSGDFNGDGKDDLAVGVPYENDKATDDGMAVIFYGSTSGLLPAANPERIGQTSAGAQSESNDRFGFSLAAGDFNGDGKDDLAAGVPYEDDKATDDGMAVIFYGSTNGLLPANYERIGQTSAGAQSESNDRFGYSLASGDFNGDGKDDLAAGVPYENDKATDDGMAVIFYGSTNGLLPANYERIGQTSAGAQSESNDRFGFSLAAGDFNGDGKDDLAAGVPYEDDKATDDGMAVIFYGSTNGLLPATYERIGQTSAGAQSESNDRFGYSLASGDFNGDGKDDLAAGVPYENDKATDDGMAVIFYGSTSGLLPAAHPERIGQTSAGAASEANDSFGFSLAAGDFNGDGYDDLSAGTPFEDIAGEANNGAVYVFEGDDDGLL